MAVGIAAVVGWGGTPSVAEEPRPCTGHITVSVTHAPPRPALYGLLPMFEYPDRHWTPRRARELLHVRRGPALIGVHLDHARDLGTHSGVHFEAVPVAETWLGGPAKCAPEYDPASASPTPGVCLAWWPDRRTRSRRARDCSGRIEEGTALGTIPLSRGRTLAYWLILPGRRAPAVVPTGLERRAGLRAIRFKRAEGQLWLAVARRWPFRSFDYRYVEGGETVRQRGPHRRG